MTNKNALRSIAPEVRLGVTWFIVISIAASTDFIFGSMGRPDLQTAAWLLEFGGMAIITPFFLIKDRRVAWATFGMISSGFLLTYNVIWEAYMIVFGHWSGGPISIYPFQFYLPIWAWYLMIILGLLIFIVSDSVLLAIGLWPRIEPYMPQKIRFWVANYGKPKEP